MQAPHRRCALLTAGLTATLTASLATSPAGAAGTSALPTLERVNVSSAEQQTQGNASRFLSMSSTGRYVAFETTADDLVQNDSNGDQDVFVRDRIRGVTTRASVSTSGQQGNGVSLEGAISGDGRYVAFTSTSTNLVAGDTNRYTDVFVRDLKNRSTRRVSVSTSGRQAQGFSAAPSISADGRYVAFTSAAANLTTGDRNGSEDVFVRDLRKQTTSRVSIPRRGAQFAGPSAHGVISDSGRYVAFIANPNDPDNFDVFLRDRKAKTTRWVSPGLGGKLLNGAIGPISISGNGRYVGYTSDASNIVKGDSNGQWDAFVFDARTAKTRRVSIGTGGTQSNAFSDRVSLSRTGRYVGFASEASNLVPGDTNGVGDAFVRDLTTGLTRRISTSAGQQGNYSSGPTYAPQVALSDDGHHAAFVSEADNLAVNDTNDATDVFAWDDRKPS